jgi:rhodanese-related sulfurtransferase
MYQNVDNSTFKNLMRQPNMIVFDVRTAKEISEGIISGTTEFSDINNVEEFNKTLSRLDKTKNYLVYCRSGARSAKACRQMEEKGFIGKIYNLAMGITGWDGAKK